MVNDDLLSLFIPFQTVYTASVALQRNITYTVRRLNKTQNPAKANIFSH